MRWIAVGPADRLRFVVVAPDVASNLAREIRNGAEDATREQVALNLRKPEFNLIEPGGIGGREVEMDAGMRVEERVHALRFVGRKVIDNHMNLPTAWLRRDDVAEKLDERRTRVARHRLADDLAGGRIQRRIQR